MSRRIFIVGLLIVAACLLLAFFSPQPLYAHGSGLTLTATTSEYVIDVDYDTFVIAAGLPGRFTLSLFSDEARTKPIEFTQVWVRIVRVSDHPGGNVVFSGWIAKGLYGSTGFSTVIAETGAYEMTLRYNDGEEELTEATLPFTVVPAVSDKSIFKTDRNFWIGFCFGSFAMTVVAFGLWFIRRRR